MLALPRLVMGGVLLVASCDESDVANDDDHHSSTSGGSEASSETSDAETTAAQDVPQECIDAVTLQPGDAQIDAETACAFWAESWCGASGTRGECVAVGSLGVPGVDVEIRCLWSDTWLGAAQEACEAGVAAAQCLGAWYVGDGGPGGPYFRSVDATQVEVVSNYSVEQPIGYKVCSVASAEVPAACTCLEGGLD